MPTVKSLDHVNIRAASLEESVRFYADVLELEPRPPFPGADPGRIVWMHDASGRPVIHLNTPGDDDVGQHLAPNTGPVHHVAFECSGHDAILERLQRLGLACRTVEVAPLALRQIFVTDPNGVLLELNFRGD